jgi:hypothetical protein
MRRYAQTSAIQRFAALDRRLRAPFVSGDGDLPLPSRSKARAFRVEGCLQHLENAKHLANVG